jgi:hypothetical protein
MERNEQGASTISWHRTFKFIMESTESAGVRDKENEVRYPSSFRYKPVRHGDLYRLGSDAVCTLYA